MPRRTTKKKVTRKPATPKGPKTFVPVQTTESEPKFPQLTCGVRSIFGNDDIQHPDHVGESSTSLNSLFTDDGELFAHASCGENCTVASSKEDVEELIAWLQDAIKQGAFQLRSTL